jgi:hypothetical protein
MNNVTESRKIRRNRRIQIILLFLAILTSPALCCGGQQVLDVLPATWLPGPLNFVVNLFEAEAQFVNHTSETVYLTAMTTTYGDPRVIPQDIAFRQRDIPIRPDETIVLQYDSADFPLAGIVVCRTDDDCRLLPANGSSVYELNAYHNLESLDPAWRQAIDSQPVYNFSRLIIIALGLVCLLLFTSYLYLNRREKLRRG